MLLVQKQELQKNVKSKIKWESGFKEDQRSMETASANFDIDRYWMISDIKYEWISSPEWRKDGNVIIKMLTVFHVNCKQDKCCEEHIAQNSYKIRINYYQVHVAKNFLIILVCIEWWTSRQDLRWSFRCLITSLESGYLKFGACPWSI